MKKKYLLLIIISIILVGCFNKEIKENTMEVIEIKDNQIGLEIENIEIKKVISTSKNYAVVMDKENDIYIIDSDNKYVGTINKSNDNSIYQINDNGYIYQNINGDDKIYDKNGKELLKSSNNEEYFFGISPDNLLIRKVKNKDNDLKEVYRYEVIDINNKIIIKDLKKELDIKEIGSISIVYLGGNIYVVSSKDNDYLYNISLNKSREIENIDYNDCSKKITEKDNLEKCYTIINNNLIRINNNRLLIKEDLEVLKLSKYDIVIDNNYYYSYSDKAIKKFDGTIIKDMKTYDVNDIFYKENKYYLATVKGLLTFDNKFNQVGNIIKLGSSIKKITSYGIIVNKNSDKRESAIYDFNYKLLKDLDNLYLYDFQDFISKTFVDGVDNNTNLYNIKVGDFIQIAR